MASDPVDVDLVRKAQTGDAAAYRQLVERHGPKVFGFFVRSLRNEALSEEFFQETFLRCYQHLKNFDPDRLNSDFRLWLYTMAVNLLRDQLRRAEVRRVLEPSLEATSAPAAPAADPESEAALSELRDRVRDSIPRLPDIAREVLLLHYYRGLTQAEIALVLGIPAGTVKSRLRIAVEALRQYFPAPRLASTAEVRP
jgi:RNA polymerase sigma-70 factor, ECF subfamily